MLTYLYDLFMSIVTYIIGLFGVEMNKKNVSFALGSVEDTDKKEPANLAPIEETQTESSTESSTQ